VLRFNIPFNDLWPGGHSYQPGNPGASRAAGMQKYISHERIKIRRPEPEDGSCKA
jgi:hypothetical protein